MLRMPRISPMGMTPQKARRPRLVVICSCFDLNRETLKLELKEAMQLGKALERILAQIEAANPAHGPVQLTKVDIADGFYQVWLNLSDIPKLAASVPSFRGEEPLLAFPLVPPMGWTKSPPCSSAPQRRQSPMFPTEGPSTTQGPLTRSPTQTAPGTSQSRQPTWTTPLRIVTSRKGC